MNDVLIALLSHQAPEPLERTMALWEPVVFGNTLLLVYGGDAAVFPQIKFEPKVFIADPRLRARDQQRERQSWCGVLQSIQRFLDNKPTLRYVYLVEYDHIPLVPDLLTRLINRLDGESADAIAQHLHRIDGTSNPHYLYHASNPHFHDFFRTISVRRDSKVILSMLGTGSFWKREAFAAIASREEPLPVYVELYLPTLAHHLGFRLRDISDQNQFVMHLGNRVSEIDGARQMGAWTLHPVKTLPL
jgi:hypothetical protein